MASADQVRAIGVVAFCQRSRTRELISSPQLRSQAEKTSSRTATVVLYLVAKLRERGASRRRAVRILNHVFREMGLALRRGEYVEFPFGYLKAEKRLSQRWQMIGDEPMRPWRIKLVVDENGERLLAGEKRPAPAPGWSRKPDRKSLVYRWDQALKRDRKRAPGSAGTRREAANKYARSGK